MARGRKTSLVVTLTAEERDELEFWQRCTTLPVGLVRRGKIILLRADGVSISDISRTVGMARRFVAKWIKRFLFTPVHCSWMNQVEQWFSLFQRKRFRIADFASKDDLRAKIEQFIAEWNQRAHPFNWSTKSVAKIMAEAPPELLAA